jgi:hypothetical protein
VRRGFDPDAAPKDLTPDQKMTAAWAYHVKGVDQHTLAAIYGVNQGRISAACKAVECALKEPKATNAAPQEG